jgi:hypothetical protein
VKLLRRNRSGVIALAALPACSLLSGCLVVGYSSRGGAFIWPGGFGLIVIIVLLWLFLRGR